MSLLAAQRPRAMVALVGAALAATATLAPVSAQAVDPTVPSSPLLLSSSGSVQRLGTDGLLTTLNGLLGGHPVLSEDVKGDVLAARGTVLVTLAPDGTQTQATLSGVNDIVGLASGNGATYLLDQNGSATNLLKYTPGSPPQAIPALNGTDYTALANDALGNVVVADAAGLINQILASGGTAPAPIATGLTGILGLAENAGTIYLLDAAGAVKQILAGSGAVSTVPGTSSLQPANALAVDPAGNLYLSVPGSGPGSGFYEVPTGSTTPLPLTVNGVLPSSVTSMIAYTPVATTPGTAGYPAARFRVRTTVHHVRRHHARVTASGLMAGEAYTIRLRKRVVAHGTASSTGTIRVSVKIPRCFHGKGAVKVTGATAARTGTAKLKVKHAPAGCHR